MSLKEKELYEFSEFRLDVAEHLLIRIDTSEHLHLSEKAFETLCILVRNAGHLVNKNELMNQVWADSFVEENNLNKCIHAIRRALGEKSGEQKFIETVKKHGFRFVAEVHHIKLAESSNIRDTENSFELKKERNLTSEYQRFVKQKESQKSVIVGLADLEDETKVYEESFELANVLNKAEEISQSISSNLNLLIPIKKEINIYFYVLAGGICIALLAGYFLYLLSQRNSNLSNFSNLNIVRLTATGKTKLAAISPDGKFVAHVQQNGEHGSLWLKQISGESEIEIIAQTSGNIRAVNFSPDGNLIYYIIGETDFRGTLFQISTLGGQSKKVLENIYLANLGVCGVGFAPSGKKITFIRLSPPPNDTSFLMIADADGTNEQELLSYKRPDLLYGTPVWSNDGATIISPFQNSKGMNAIEVKVERPDVVRTILPIDLNALSQIVWLPDGQNLLIVAEDDTETILNQLYQVSYDGGFRRRVNKDFNNYESISASADGKNLIAVRTEQTAHLWMMPTNDESKLNQLTDGFEKYDGVNGLGWMLDDRIYYESIPGGKQAILQINEDGSNLKQLSTGGGYGSVSPDGRLLVYQKCFIKNNKLSQGLFLFDKIQGTEQQLTSGWDLWAEFAPDGRSINYIRWGEDEVMATLRNITMEGGSPQHLTKFLAITAAVSPDNKSIAIARWEGTKTQIVIIPIGGGNPVKIFDLDFKIQDRFGKRSIQWSADGRAIDFIRESKSVSNIWEQSVEGGEPLQLTNFTFDVIFNFAFSKDGKKLALSRGAINSDVVSFRNSE